MIRFDGESFDDRDLSNSFLGGCLFENCTFRNCKFNGSDLSFSVFRECDFYNASFVGSVLYVTRIISCDATKADFKGALLNGIRIKDTELTHAKFDNLLSMGHERKRISNYNGNGDYCKVKPFETMGVSTDIEDHYDGIYCESSGLCIKFEPTDTESWRINRRKSEVARSIQKALSDNNYSDKSLHYYFLCRQHLRKSMRSPLLHLREFLFAELFWGYGVKVTNPLVVFLINPIIFSIIYAIIPLYDNDSGILWEKNPIPCFDQNGLVLWDGYFKILYVAYLISMLSVFGPIDIAGIGKLLVVVHIFISVVSIGLGVSVITKKLANI